MRAGRSSSAAMTRSRSPRSSAGERSTMRYWMGLLSGTRRLGDEALDHAQRLALAPVALAEGRVAQLSRGVDEEGHRQPARLPLGRGLLVGVEQHRKRDPLALEELVDARRRFA